MRLLGALGNVHDLRDENVWVRDWYLKILLLCRNFTANSHFYFDSILSFSFVFSLFVRGGTVLAIGRGREVAAFYILVIRDT
jgi:hypothetical protein